MLLLRTLKGNLEIWQWVLLLAVLFPMAVKDYRTKKVNIYLCLITILEALSIRAFILKETNIVLLIDMMPGLLMLLFALVTKEAIGFGDGIVLMYIGSVVGFRLEMEILLISMLMAGILSLGLIVFKKIDKKAEIPFIPFLSIGVIAGGII